MGDIWNTELKTKL